MYIFFLFSVSFNLLSSRKCCSSSSSSRYHKESGVAKEQGPRLNKESGVSIEQGVSAEQGVSVSIEQGVQAEQEVRRLKRTSGPSSTRSKEVSAQLRTRSQGSQMNKGSQLNKESGISINQRVSAEQESQMIQGASAERLELTTTPRGGSHVEISIQLRGLVLRA